MKAISLFMAAICFCGFVACVLLRDDGDSWKPALGGAWGTFVFVCGYFGLKNIKRWDKSDGFKEASREFHGIIEVGMATDEAERLLQSQARLIDVADRRYYGGRYQNRKFRVTEFDGRVSRVKVLSLDSRVFEIQTEPKR